MKKKKDKSNKIKFIVLLFVIGLFIAASIFYIYDSFFNSKGVIKEESSIVTLDNDFYNIDYLVVNKYIKTINSTVEQKYSTNEQDNPYMIKIEDNEVYVANDLKLDDKDIDLVKATGIKGTPKVVKYLNYQKKLVFYVLTKEGNLFYADTQNEDDSITVNEFIKINETKILNLYDFYIDDNITYPWYPLTIYSENEQGDLLKTNGKDITTTFKEDYPLLDQICGGWSDKDSCIGLYISPDKNLYLMTDKDNKLYQEISYKGKNIEVKDAFSIADIKITNDDNASLNKIKYYIIGRDNYLYEVIENNKNKIISIKKYNNNEILSYKYNTDSNDYSASVNYRNGDKDYFKNVSVFSSLYYRYYK